MEPEQLASTDKAPQRTQAASPGAQAHPPGSRAWLEWVLSDRLQASAQPSRLLNQLYDAQARCAAHAHALQQAVVRSPRISRLIRKTLRDAFQADPDSLMLNVPLAHNDPPWHRSMTDTVMRLLAERACARAEHLSEQACQAGALADRVLDEVLEVDLLARIEAAVPAYWRVLAESDVCSRRERWCALYKSFVADQALLAHGLNQLSDTGLAMLMTLVEAPTAQARTLAGGVRAGLRVAEGVYPGQGDLIAFSGALHLFYIGEAADPRQLLILPGLEPPFYEFSTYEHWQRDFPALVQTHIRRLWDLLPLRQRHQLPDWDATASAGRRGALITDDALVHSAEALLQVQWDNELATLLEVNIAYLFHDNAIKGDYMSPVERLLHVEQGRGAIGVQPGLKAVLGQLLERDKQRRRLEISFASLSTRLPLRTCEAKVRRYEQALHGLLDPADPRRERQDFGTVVALHSQWQQARARCAALLDGHEERLHEPTFWNGMGADADSVEKRLLAARGAALVAEAQLQHRLKLIDSLLLARISALVDGPVRMGQADRSQVLALSIGGQTQPRYSLVGAFVVAGAAEPGDISASQAVMLYMPGSEGGLQRFKSLAVLSQRVQASFTAREPGALWHCIARGQRNAARAWVQGLAAQTVPVVSFEAIHGDVLKVGLQAQIAALAEARAQLQRNERLFSEVSDTALASSLLAMETAQNLQVPPNDARERALSNVELVIAAARLSAALPVGPDDAPASVHRQRRRLFLRQQRSALNLQRLLVRHLGDVEHFGRQRLIQQLTQDGVYPQLNIDTPLFDVPDDVSMVWAGHPERLPGEAGPKTVVSAQRSTFSFLQLALHNLDPEAPWTRWRLNHMKCLDPAWRARLSVDYLIRTIAALDIGGHYERRIFQVCYGDRGNDATAEVAPLLHELLRRPVRREAKLQLINARQRPLSEKGVRLFEQALKATPGAGREAALLSVVRLEALTLPWARHIAGLVVIHDRHSSHCLLYWPQASGFPALTEYPHLDALRQALLAQGQTQDALATLANSVAAGSETEALASYPGGIRARVEPASRWRCMLERSKLFTLSAVLGPAVAVGKCLYRWFQTKRVFPATTLSEIETELREQRDADPQQWLGISATNADDLLGLLAHARVLQAQRQARAESNSRHSLQAYRAWRQDEATARVTRGLLALIPLVGLGVLAYEVLIAARRLYHSGSADDAVELAITLHQLLIEVALTFVPVKGVGAVAKPLSGAPGRLMNSALRQLHRGYRRLGTLAVRPPASPVRLKGLDLYKLHGAVSEVIELKAPLDKGTFIRNGERYVPDAKGQRFGVYQREGEQRLRFRNRQTPGENELFVYVEEPREWLLGADRLEPQPGTSAGAGTFWQPTPSSTPVSWAPPSQYLAGDLTKRAHNLTSYWREWGQALDAAQVRELVPDKRLYIADGRRGALLKIGEHYYDTLPAGSQSQSDALFLKPRGELMQSIDQLTRCLSENLPQQPAPFTFGEDLRWTAREPLFSRPLPASMGARFPDLTPSSIQQATRRLVELADAGTAVTGTRLLNIRATLNKWTPRSIGAMVETDDLLTMLRPLSPRKKGTLYVGADTEVGGFERVDFYLPAALDVKLFSRRTGDRATTHARVTASADAVSDVLRRQGFVVKRVPVPHHPQYLHLDCTHPASGNRYFVLIKWLDGRSLSMKLGRERAMSHAWLMDKSRLHPDIYKPFQAAQEQGRLVKLFAGIQNVNPPTVYFIRPADLS
ncbi:MAG: dermonecrotic toxin domain-containing protein [Pseudomonas sp.]|uniref:dermonecrotic toxin domain-containing protein n=1 Tax=Pseudomonas sp. TaxID=306 RepID=UPI003919FC00